MVIKMKITCVCGNELNHSGHYQKVQKGKSYYTFYCKHCKKMIAVESKKPNELIIDYTLEKLDER